MTQVWTVRDGKGRAGSGLYKSIRAEALEAVGLSEQDAHAEL